MRETTDAAVGRIHEITLARPVPGIRLVGIDGPAGAGKSTLAMALTERFGWPVVEIDDFFSWVSFDSWWPRFEVEVVEPLLAGRSIRYRTRDWAGDELGEGLAGWKQLKWAPVVVLEGVGSTRRAIAGSLACRVWVDAPEAERLERGVARDGESHRALWESYLPREAAFFAADRAVERSDVRVDAGGRVDPSG
ncbi:uridine kinase [Microbacterium sp. SS28]|uniref:uridine kinase family protein n=1 Tax=Microbacterium sp. SS28 TaxID=2919948 RepID=UPI001FAB1828|nr:(d)CMP kinase [Microbacterium sp. SS28]